MTGSGRQPVPANGRSGASRFEAGAERGAITRELQPGSSSSGWMNAQHIGISEHFEFEVNVDSTSPPQPTDYLYYSSATDNLWDGQWGLLRAFKSVNHGAAVTPLEQPGLKPLPSNPLGVSPSTPGQSACPQGAKPEIREVAAWRVRDLLPNPPRSTSNRSGARLGISAGHNTDPQIASRFEPFALPRWRESSGLREFFVSFGRLLPLHLPSPFGDKDMVQKLMAYSGGLTGRMTTLLAQAAELAIRQKTESISLALLDQAASAGIFKIPAEEETDDAMA